MTDQRFLQDGGVFKGEKGLDGLLNANEFWEQQPYGTRLYYGDGIADYLHRDVLRTAALVLASRAAISSRTNAELTGRGLED